MSFCLLPFHFYYTFQITCIFCRKIHFFWLFEELLVSSMNYITETRQFEKYVRNIFKMYQVYDMTIYVIFVLTLYQKYVENMFCNIFNIF
jgi:hypothetical protein